MVHQTRTTEPKSSLGAPWTLVALLVASGCADAGAQHGRLPSAGQGGTGAIAGAAGTAGFSAGSPAHGGAGASNAAGTGGTPTPSGGSKGTSTGGAGGAPVAGGAGAGANGNAATGSGGDGGTNGAGSGDGGASRGGAGAAGVGAAAGGTANGGKGGQSGMSNTAGGGPYPELRFSGLVSAVELAPLRLAANGLYPAKITIGSGGVDDLCGASPSADIATNAETQFLRATGAAGCEKVRIVFTMCEGLYRIVAKKSAGVSALADLAGKRVMAPAGASSAYFLGLMLSAAGLTAGTGAGQVNVVSGNPSGSTFMGGAAPDAATIWEPGIEQAAEALGSDAVVIDNKVADKEVYRELFNLHTTTDVLADPAKRRGVVELVRNLIAASAALRADPTVADAVLTGPTGVSASVLHASMKYERFAGTLASDLLDVLEAEEPWRANVDNRAARSREALAASIDDSVLADALAGT